MKLGIMQPYFFPYIGYFQLLNFVDSYVIYDDVNYIKGGWINRNRILSNGKPTFFNVPMNGASPNKLISEVEVSLNPVLKRKMLQTLELNYKKAPYFKDVFPLLKNLIENEEPNLAKYLEYTLRGVCEYLGIRTRIICSSEIAKNNELRGQDKVLEICRLLQADEYYNAVGGMELYSKEVFKSKGIKLGFLKTKEIVYSQFKNEFVPFLSIIDVMMFCSKEEIGRMLDQYELL